MAYEFKSLGTVEKLSEVPENANAFIEVDGAIKRVSGSSLGGGEWDLVITDDYHNGVITLDSGSYQNVYNKIMVDQEPPKILIKSCYSYGDIAYGVDSNIRYANIIVDEDDANSHYLDIYYSNWSWYEAHIHVYPDNTISAPWQ